MQKIDMKDEEEDYYYEERDDEMALIDDFVI